MTKFDKFRRGKHVHTKFGKVREIKRVSDKVKPMEYEYADDCTDSYVNIGAIDFDKNNFTVRFGKFLPGQPKPKITKTFSLNAKAAKSFFYALRDNITNFDKKNED